MNDFLQQSLNFYRQINSCEFSRDNHWDEHSGHYRGDCSGFILQLLAQFRPHTLARLQSFCGKPRPKAFEIFDWLDSEAKNFDAFPQTPAQTPPPILVHYQVEHLRAGQLICWRKQNPPKSGDTGHIAVITEMQALTAERWRLQLLDCSKQGHDNDLGARPGVGLGWIEVTADSRGALIGYCWGGELQKQRRTRLVLAAL